MDYLQDNALDSDMADTIRPLNLPTGVLSQYENGVSIIIPCHKCGETLPMTIASILKNQPLTVPFEIIMVNDSPNDMATVTACNDALLACDQAGVAVMLRTHSGNKGVAAARNTALAVAKYRYTFPIDSDDELPDGSRFIDKAVAVMDKSIEVMCVAPTLQRYGALQGIQKPPHYRERTQLLENIIPACCIFRTNEAMAAGKYNTGLRAGEDWDLWVALSNARYKNGMARKVVRLEDHYMYRAAIAQDSLTVNGSKGQTMADRYRNLARRSPDLYLHHFGTTDQKKLMRIFYTRRALFSLARRYREVKDGARAPQDLGRYMRMFGQTPRPK